MSAFVVPHCLRLYTRCIHPRNVCVLFTPVAWHTSGKGDSSSRKSGSSRRSSKSKRKSDRESHNRVSSENGKELKKHPVTSCTFTQQLQPPAGEVRVANTPSSASWVPTVQDYEALTVDLLLYRRESVEAVLAALSKERALFEDAVRKMEENVADLYLLRDEIREMLENGAAVQKQALTDALQLIAAEPSKLEAPDADCVPQKTSVAPPQSNDDDDDSKEIVL